MEIVLHRLFSWWKNRSRGYVFVCRWRGRSGPCCEKAQWDELLPGMPIMSFGTYRQRDPPNIHQAVELWQEHGNHMGNAVGCQNLAARFVGHRTLSHGVLRSSSSKYTDAHSHLRFLSISLLLGKIPLPRLRFLTIFLSISRTERPVVQHQEGRKGAPLLGGRHHSRVNLGVREECP